VCSLLQALSSLLSLYLLPPSHIMSFSTVSPAEQRFLRAYAQAKRDAAAERAEAASGSNPDDMEEEDDSEAIKEAQEEQQELEEMFEQELERKEKELRATASTTLTTTTTTTKPPGKRKTTIVPYTMTKGLSAGVSAITHQSGDHYLFHFRDGSKPEWLPWSATEVLDNHEHQVAFNAVIAFRRRQRMLLEKKQAKRQAKKKKVATAAAASSVPPHLAKLVMQRCPWCADSFVLDKATGEGGFTCKCCKAATYCSKMCKVRAWEGGHKRKCQVVVP
jgi:hypothetical protein